MSLKPTVTISRETLYRVQKLSLYPIFTLTTDHCNPNHHFKSYFKIPEEVSVLKAAARLNPERMYVQKNKNHRGIKIEKIENLDLKSQGSFVQEFVDDPFLIDGYKVAEIRCNTVKTGY